MAKYRVILTREASESRSVDVEAGSAAEANLVARELAGRYGENLNGWDLDDNMHDVYLPDEDSTEEVDEPEVLPSLRPRRVIVACNGCNGPDLYFVKVLASDAQVESGLHYETAVRQAIEDGYDAFENHVEFDEDDSAGRAMMDLFEWDTASEVRCFDLDISTGH